MKRAAIYRRISNDREGRELGIDRQEQDCRALAERLKHTVVAIYTDNDISASTRSRKLRPDYRRMIADARTGAFDTVLAYTSGRLTRRPRESEDLIDLAEQCGTTFEYVASPSFDLNTSAGRRIARILAANDAGEAEDIAERVLRQKMQAAADGDWLGGRRPYGYETDGVTVRLAEARVLRRVTDDILAGGSLRGLSRALNEEGDYSSTGRPWTGNELRRVLLRPRNAGLMEHRGRLVGQARWPAIVDPERWRAVVSVLTDPGRRTQWASGRRWLLSGLASCGVCGSPVLCTLANAAKRAQPTYTCKAGKHVGRNAHELDRYVGEVVVRYMSGRDVMEALTPSAARRMDVANLRANAAALQERLAGLASAYADGVITAEQLREGSERARGKLLEVELELARFARGSVLSGVADAEDVEQAWASASLDRRRAIIAALVQIVINPARKGRPAGWRPGQPYFDPATVEITSKLAGG